MELASETKVPRSKHVTIGLYLGQEGKNDVMVVADLIFYLNLLKNVNSMQLNSF